MHKAEDNEKQERQAMQSPEATALKSQDAQAARQAGSAEMSAAESIRTNKSDGSLRKYAGLVEQEQSIELYLGDSSASRASNLTEKQLLAQVKNKAIEQQSKTIGELEQEIKSNPALEPVLMLRRHAEQIAAGPDQEKYLKLAREQAAEISPDMRQRLARRYGEDQENCGSHEVPQKVAEALKGQVAYPEQEIEGLRRLTPEDLRKLAKAMEAGGPAAEESIRQTTQEILVRTGESSRDTMLAGIKLVVDVLKYDRDLVFNPEKAREDAGKAGEALAPLIVAGVLFGAGTAGAVEEVKRTGDYSLPLSRLGAGLNSWYEKQSPGDQMAIMAEICAGFGVVAGAAEVNKLRKPGAFMAFLKEGYEAMPRNPEAERRAIEALSRVFKGREPLAQGVGRDYTYAMSKADDLHGKPLDTMKPRHNTEVLKAQEVMELAQQKAIKESVKDKVENYLLSPTQKNERYKWFDKALGFTLENKEDLIRQIVFDQAKLRPARSGDFGLVYEQVGSLRGANGKILENCRFYWHQDPSTGLFRFANIMLPKKRK